MKMTMAKVIQFPKCLNTNCCPNEGGDQLVQNTGGDNGLGPVKTLVISDSVFAAPANAFKWPSAGPVDSRYEKALEEQKKKQNDS